MTKPKQKRGGLLGALHDLVIFVWPPLPSFQHSAYPVLARLRWTASIMLAVIVAIIIVYGVFRYELDFPYTSP